MAGENTVEILIRARDEATRVLSQATGQMLQATQAAAQSSQALVRSSDQLARSSGVTSRELRAAGTSARFAAVSLVNELSPALSGGVSRLAGLASVAALSGTAVGALATVGIAGLVIALGAMISNLVESRKAQEEWNEAIRSGSTLLIEKEIAAINKRIEAQKRALAEGEESLTLLGQYSTMTELAAIHEKNLSDLIARRSDLTRTLMTVQKGSTEQAQVAAAMSEILREKYDKERTAIKELNTAAAQLAKTQGDALSRQEAILELAPLLTKEEAHIFSLTEAYRELGEVTERVNQERADSLRTLEEQATSIAFVQAESLVKAIDESRDPVIRTMTTLGNSAADALFDAMLGRSRNLADVFKSFFEGFARDIFRNTLAKAFGGEAQGLTLQNLLSLGGGGSPFGRVAAAVTGTAGITASAQAAEAAGMTVPTADILREALPTGLTGAQFFGGVAGVGIGALGILGASQAQDPLSGALSGGLGGLSAGLGLASLGLGASAVLGPIGLVAGLAFGIFSGASGRRKRKREEARQRRIQEQVQAITAGLEGVDTLEELEAISADLRAGIEVPGGADRFGGAFGPRRIPLEPEAQRALDERVRQLAIPLILKAGQEEIAGTRSLAGIREILARGVSPDVGGVELRLEALRREQEILGGLEGIGGISIEAQLEGGVLRRTVFGAGAFGIARARQAGGDFVLDESSFRRLQRVMLSDRAFLEQFLREAFAHASGIGWRFDDMESLR